MTTQIPDQELQSGETLEMSVVEAGRLLGCAKNKSYQLAKQNTFPVIRLNGRLVVPRARFMRWLNGEEELPGE